MFKSLTYRRRSRQVDRQPITAVLIILVIFITFFIFIAGKSYAQLRRIGAEPVTIDQAQKQAIIDSVLADLDRTYVLVDEGKAMDKLLRRNLKKKKYDELNTLDAFTRRLTEDLHSVFPDGHLWVRPLPPGWVTEQDTLTEEERAARELELDRRDNFGFRKVEILPGNIGYLKFNHFTDAKYGGATAIAAMNFLANVDALIIDLRDNGGGNPSQIQLITSYFFDEPQHLNDFFIRASGETHQFWTPDYVQGKRLVDQPIYILTSNYTFSGAEEFTYNLKNMERATVIGDTTGGGAHPTDRFAYATLGVMASIPFGKAVNPITKTNWEGTGVAPDIAVPSDEALDVAKLEAFKKLLENPRNDEHRAFLQWYVTAMEAIRNPMTISMADMHDYVGDYGPRHIRIENNKLIYQRDDREPYVMQPVGNDMFLLPDLLRFRIQFERDTSGNVTKIVGLYEDGFTDESPRTGG